MATQEEKLFSSRSDALGVASFALPSPGAAFELSLVTPDLPARCSAFPLEREGGTRRYNQTNPGVMLGLTIWN